LKQSVETQGIEPMFAIVSKAVYTTVKQLDIIFSYLIIKKGLKNTKIDP